MFSFFSNLLGGLSSLFLDVVNGLLGGVVLFLTRIVNSLGGIVELLDSFKSGIIGFFSGFLNLVSALFPFIPGEWITILTTTILMTIVGVIIKKKVFG